MNAIRIRRARRRPRPPARLREELGGLERAVGLALAAAPAAELYISPGTAAIHVSHILRKLGVAGRVEAAGVAHRRGLADDAGVPPAPGAMG